MRPPFYHFIKLVSCFRFDEKTARCFEGVLWNRPTLHAEPRRGEFSDHILSCFDDELKKLHTAPLKIALKIDQKLFVLLISLLGVVKDNFLFFLEHTNKLYRIYKIIAVNYHPSICTSVLQHSLDKFNSACTKCHFI